MSLHAFDSLGDSLAATRAVLPDRIRDWLILAAIVPFLGTTGVAVSFSTGNTGAGTGDIDGEVAEFSLPVAELTAHAQTLLAVVAGVVALWLAFVLLGALFEFAFFETLRTGEVAVRRDVSTHWRKGLGLFGFRVALTAGYVAVIGALVVRAVQRAGGLDAPLFELLFALGSVAVPLTLLGIPVQLVAAFTTAFVVPTMLAEHRGVLSGWRRLLPIIRREWKEFAAYAVVSTVLVIAGGIVVSLVVGIVFVGVAIFVGGLVAAGLVAAGGLAGIGLLGQLALVAVALLVVGLLLVVYAVVLVPIDAYLRYYPLFLLGDVEPDLDYIPDRRAALRHESSEP